MVAIAEKYNSLAVAIVLVASSASRDFGAVNEFLEVHHNQLAICFADRIALPSF